MKGLAAAIGVAALIAAYLTIAAVFALFFAVTYPLAGVASAVCFALGNIRRRISP